VLLLHENYYSTIMVRVKLWPVALGFLAAVEAADVLSTSGFQECGNGTQAITVSQFELSFDRSTKELVFAVAGKSLVSQNVTGMAPHCCSTDHPATINVTALGQVRYTNSFNPCEYVVPETRWLKLVTISNNSVQFPRDRFTPTGILQSQISTSTKFHQ